ncbi:MAG: AraC family transcriptional regulator, partial [Myxococcota bacterium]
GYKHGVVIQLLRQITSEPPAVRCMRSRRPSMPEEEQAAYEEFLGAPVEFEAEHAQLVVHGSALRLPLTTADTELSTYFDGVLQAAAGTPSETQDLLDETRRLIAERLPQGAPSAEDVAKCLGLGVRTFQRRLSEHGSSYAELLDATRRALAERLLSDSNLSLSEVAYVLGYSEKASFHRAFKRWHPLTPAEYRASRRAR